jgi:hypothetical protein
LLGLTRSELVLNSGCEMSPRAGRPGMVASGLARLVII